MWCCRRIGNIGGTDHVRYKVLRRFIEGNKRLEVARRWEIRHTQLLDELKENIV